MANFGASENIDIRYNDTGIYQVSFARKPP